MPQWTKYLRYWTLGSDNEDEIDELNNDFDTEFIVP